MHSDDFATGFVALQEALAAMQTLNKRYMDAIACAMDLLVTRLDYTPEEACLVLHGQEGIDAIDGAYDTIAASMEVMRSVKL